MRRREQVDCVAPQAPIGRQISQDAHGNRMFCQNLKGRRNTRRLAFGGTLFVSRLDCAASASREPFATRPPLPLRHGVVEAARAKQRHR